MAEQRTESREDVAAKFGFDPGHDQSRGIVIERFGDRIRVIGEMMDRGDEFVEFVEVQYRRPPLIDEVARARAEG